MYDPTKPYIKQIHDLIRPTWRTPYLDVQEGIYATFEKKFSYLEVDHTDGIGTKGVYHWQKRTFREAVQDALAMNLNDLALVGATTYKLQNHIIIPEDDREIILGIIGTLAEECKKRNIAITGGETSIHDNAEGLDISISVSGFIPKLFKNKFRVGDTLVGFKSNGLHSNGFTKIRQLFGDEFRDEFTTPTAIYSDAILPLLAQYNIGGMMHITGGAYTKLKQILPSDADVIINTFESPEIFYEIYKKGVTDEEMYKTFNCGIGFILSAAPPEAQKISQAVDEAIIIGEITNGIGTVKIQSGFSKRKIKL